MTLAACVFLRNHIVHVSDRRITLDGPRGQTVHSEAQNKTLIMDCIDGVVVISYCGVAVMRGPKGEKENVDNALAKTIQKYRNRQTIAELLGIVKRFLSYNELNLLDRNRKPYETSVHIVGYRDKGQIANKPFLFQVRRIGDSLRSYKIDSKQIYESFRGTDESPNGSAIFCAYPEWPDKIQLDEFKRNTSFREIHDYPAMIEVPLVEYIKNASRKNIAVGSDVLSIILPRIPRAGNEVMVRLTGTTPGVPTGATP